MKKLIIAAAAIALAVGAEAAQIKWWTEYEVCNGTGSETDFTSATVAYLINAADLTQSQIYSAVNGGQTLATAIGNSYVKSASMADGMVSTQTFTAFNGGESKSLYMVLFDKGLGDNGALYFSEQMTATINGVGATSFNFENASSLNTIASNMDSFSASSGGWVAVPEPTSGLLLVLGMAGLMLRRRRA